MKSIKLWKLLLLLIPFLHTQGQTADKFLRDSIREIIVKSQYSKLDTMKSYLQQYKNLIEPEDSSALADYHSMLGLYHSQLSEYETAKQEQLKALEIAKAIDSPLLVAKAYQRLGVIHKLHTAQRSGMGGKCQIKSCVE